MKINMKNPLKVLTQHKFTLPQIIVIVVFVGGLAFTGGLMWHNHQKQLAHEAAQKAAQAEAERLAKLEAEKQIEITEEKEENPKEADKPKPTSDPAPAEDTASLYLVGAKASKGVNLSWDVKNLSVTQGFKLLLSKTGTPVYGAKGTDGIYLKDSATRGYLWELTNGKTYYFRLCIYNGTGCSYYSNTVQVTSPYVAPEKPTGTITLSATGGSPGSNPLSWTNTGKALYGYKLVWSTASGPKYPGSSAKFYDKTATTGSITGDPGTYYVRICMYYEGSCLNYSNQVQVIIP